MKRWLRGSVVLATAVGMWSCSGDPTDSFRGEPSRIVATPASLFLSEGETKGVIVQAQDDQGDPLAVTFDTAMGPGITVMEDVTFLPTNGAPIQGQTRYLITATTFVGTTFTVSVGEQSLVIPVKSLPTTFAGTFSNVTPALGDTVTLTVPTGIKFGAETGITFPGAAGEPVITGISADSTVLSFLPAPGTDTAASVSGLELTFAPGVPVDTLVTTTKITTPAITEIPAAFSSTSPAVNQPVTVTAPGFLFIPGTLVIFGDGVAVPLDTATVVAIAADSSSVDFLANPGTTGIPTISGAVLDFLPAVPLTLPATTSVTVSSTVLPIAGTSTPATAPTYVVPAAGGSNILFDAGTFTGADLSADEGIGAQYYKLVITEAGDYTFTVNWNDVGADVDMELCSDLTCSDGGTFLGEGTTLPETATTTLEPGTYYFDAVLFAGTVPGWVSLRVDHAAAEE
jgi:hypothetical protein